VISHTTSHMMPTMARYPLNLPVNLKQAAEEAAREQGVSLNQLVLWSLAEKVSELKVAREHRLPAPGVPSRAPSCLAASIEGDSPAAFMPPLAPSLRLCARYEPTIMAMA